MSIIIQELKKNPFLVIGMLGLRANGACLRGGRRVDATASCATFKIMSTCMLGCAADVEEENCRSIAANGSPGNKEAESESLEDAVAEGDGGLTSTSRELETSRGSQMATPERAVSPASSADDGWSCISVKEKRRLWLKRRRMGEFYFRSEFKGLVHTVRTYCREAQDHLIARVLA